MRIFFVIWLGQVVSLLGSKLTEFAMGVWVYQNTGSMTQFGYVILLMYLPNVLISPIAGVLIDRWNRRYALILSDTAAGICALVVMVLVSLGRLEVWHIYLTVTVISVFNAFQLPAYTAAIAQLIPKEYQSRMNGMVQISKAIAKLLSPMIAGFLVTSIGLKGILFIDFSTFLFALTTLLVVRFPKFENPESHPRKKYQKYQLWRETISSWRYIVVRPGLLRLLIFITITYFTTGVLEVAFWPLVLTIASSKELGIVLSVGGCGMLLGSLAIGAWGGPKRRIYGILNFVPLQGAFMLLGGWQTTLNLLFLGIFGYLFAQPIVVSCNQAIWQSKVPLHLQGRIFALQQMLERSLSILAYLVTGPLVDNILEPLMAEDGILANSIIGRASGLGAGRGIALLLFLVGMLNILATIIAYRQPRLRRLEEELPDAINSDSIRFKNISSST